MHHTVIGLVNSQTGCLLDVSGHGPIIDAGLSSLEGAANAAAHEDTTGLTERVVHPLDEYLAIRAAQPSHQKSPRSAV
jgi:hypothetical protein